jgi:C1A family cysteine protease
MRPLHVTRLFFRIVLAFLILQGVSKAQDSMVPQLITPIGAVIDYEAREAEAPPAIQAELAALREQILAEELTFTVGYTFALDFSIEEITGMVPPTEPEPPVIEAIPEITPLTKPEPADPTAAEQRAPTGCSSASSFDWRRMDGATPVRDQGNCGSCWAFATHGAFEGSYKIVNDIVSDVDTSEQDTLDCSGAGSCGGGWWAFDNLISRGSAAEADYPYTVMDGSCRLNVSRPFTAVAWDYVTPSAPFTIPAVSELKEALCQHGPLGVTVAVTPLFQAYTAGVFNERSTAGINHAVTLIGWDDAQQAWLIKNSWGAGWGETGGFGVETGYMSIRYGRNSIGFAATWVDAVEVVGPPMPPVDPNLPPFGRR